MMTIDPSEYRHFNSRFSAGDFGNQRLGQAFYNHFKLHKLSDQKQLQNLYEMDGSEARGLIEQLFIFA